MSAAKRADTKSTKPKKKIVKIAKRAATSARAPRSLVTFLQERLEELAPRFVGVERRKMLASAGWFRRGKLVWFVSTRGRIVVRIPDATTQDEFLAVAGAAPMQMGSKPPMRGWILVPERWHEDDAALLAWLERAWSLSPEAEPPKKTGKRRPPSGTRGVRPRKA